MRSDDATKNNKRYLKRYKTKYPGVIYRIAERIGGAGDERVYYAVYRKDKKQVETKIGRQYADDMTPARANSIRNDYIEGRRIPQTEQAKIDKIKKLTISDVFEKYVDAHKSDKGITREVNRFDVNIKKYIGNKIFSSIVSSDIDSIKNQISHKSPKTIRNVLELILRLSNFSINKLETPGLTIKIEYPKVNNETTEDLTEDQFQQLMKVLNVETDLDAKHIILLAIFTGMRRSEIFKLKWDDLNFERKTIMIRNPKSGIDKVIPMNDLAHDVFMQCVRYKSQYVFPGRGGGPRKDIHKAAKRIMRAAGIPDDFRPMHGLRHFFGTSLICNGVDLPTLQKLMTHSSPQMTLRYAKIRDEKLAEASNRLVDIFGKKDEKNI